MKNKSILTLLAVLALSITYPCRPAHAATFTMQVLLPGMTRTIDLQQQQTLPLGCPQFFILTIGSGFLGISIVKDDIDGDTLFMTGLASAGGKLTPIFRVGASKGMIDQIIEIDGDATTLGFVWLWCGVAVSQSIPLYSSQLRLSLAP